jgi:hypothetical protein
MLLSREGASAKLVANIFGLHLILASIITVQNSISANLKGSSFAFPWKVVLTVQLSNQ